MPTAEFPVGAQTRDIFRTINGVNLTIGPHDRLRGGATGDFSNQGPLIGVTPAVYPRIVLRDSLGYELDTYTTLQEAIYRAKWNVRRTGQSKTPLEWRLPKAPPPARPDLTRTFPPVKHPQLSGGYGKTSGITDNVLEIDVDDVSFVKESLDRLPYVPSLSFLRQEILVGPKTYFQIVGTMLLHKRLLSETEKRHAIYNFPGFCSGCIRMGLCYGCERSSEPHYHEDKLVKTGGGFTYYKKDRPEREMKHKNPLNWKINHPDQVLKRLMEEYAGVHLDGDVSSKVKEHLDTRADRRTRHVSEDREAMDMDYLNKNRDRGDDGCFLPEIDRRYINEQQRDPSLLGYTTPGQGQGQGQGRGQSTDPSIDPSDVDIEMFEQEQGQRKVLSKRSTKTDLNDDSKSSDAGQLSGETNGYMQSGARSKGDKSNRDDSGTRYNGYERYEHRLPKYRKTESEDDSSEEGKRDYKGDDESRGRKRDRLYKPPPPFKVKRSPKRRIEARSPFSTDRSYDIPKGQDFVPRKSSKKPTEFVDFRNVDASWKEPKKFELKKANHKPTKFWSGARNKKKEKSRSRSPKARRPPSPRSPSPDSGLDTGFMTAIVKTKSPKKKKTKSESPRRVKHKKDMKVQKPESTVEEEEERIKSPGYHNPIDDVSDTATEFYKLQSELTGSEEDLRVMAEWEKLRMADNSDETEGIKAVADPQYQKKKVYESRSGAISPIVYEGLHRHAAESEVAIHEPHCEPKAGEEGLHSKVRRFREKRKYSESKVCEANGDKRLEYDRSKTGRCKFRDTSKSYHLTDKLAASSAISSSTGRIHKRYRRQRTSPSLEETAYQNMKRQSLRTPEMDHGSSRTNKNFSHEEEKQFHDQTPASNNRSIIRSIGKLIETEKETRHLDYLPQERYVNDSQLGKVSSCSISVDFSDKSDGKVSPIFDYVKLPYIMRPKTKTSEPYRNENSSIEKVNLPKIKVQSGSPNKDRGRKGVRMSLPKERQKSHHGSDPGSGGSGNYREIVHFPQITSRQGYTPQAVKNEFDNLIVLNENRVDVEQISNTWKISSKEVCTSQFDHAESDNPVFENQNTGSRQEISNTKHVNSRLKQTFDDHVFVNQNIIGREEINNTKNVTPRQEETAYKNMKRQSLRTPEMDHGSSRTNKNFSHEEEKQFHDQTPASNKRSIIRSIGKLIETEKETRHLDYLPQERYVNDSQLGKVSSCSISVDFSSDKSDGKVSPIFDYVKLPYIMRHKTKTSGQYRNENSPIEKVDLPKIKVQSGSPNKDRGRKGVRMSMPKVRQKSHHGSDPGSGGSGHYREIVLFPQITSRQGYTPQTVKNEFDNLIVLNENRVDVEQISNTRKISSKEACTSQFDHAESDNPVFENQNTGSRQEISNTKHGNSRLEQTFDDQAFVNQNIIGREEISNTKYVTSTQGYTAQVFKTESDDPVTHNAVGREENDTTSTCMTKVERFPKRKKNPDRFNSDEPLVSNKVDRSYDNIGQNRNESSSSQEINVKPVIDKNEWAFENLKGLGIADKRYDKTFIQLKKISNMKRTTHYFGLNSDKKNHIVADTNSVRDYNPQSIKQRNLTEQLDSQVEPIVDSESDQKSQDKLSARTNSETHDNNQLEPIVIDAYSQKRNKKLSRKNVLQSIFPTNEIAQEYNIPIPSSNISRTTENNVSPDAQILLNIEQSISDDEVKESKRNSTNDLTNDTIKIICSNGDHVENTIPENKCSTIRETCMQNTGIRNVVSQRIPLVTKKSLLIENKQTDSGIFHSDEKDYQLIEPKQGMSESETDYAKHNSGCTDDLDIMNRVTVFNDNMLDKNKIILNIEMTHYISDDGNIGDDEYENQSDLEDLDWDCGEDSDPSSIYNPESETRKTSENCNEFQKIEMFGKGFNSSDIHTYTEETHDKVIDTEQNSNTSGEGEAIEGVCVSKAVSKESGKRHDNMLYQNERDRGGFISSGNGVFIFDSDNESTESEFKSDIDDIQKACVRNESNAGNMKKKQHKSHGFRKPNNLRKKCKNVVLPHKNEIQFSEQCVDKRNLVQTEDSSPIFATTDPFGNEQILSKNIHTLIDIQSNTDLFNFSEQQDAILENNLSEAGYKTTDKLFLSPRLPKIQGEENKFYSKNTKNTFSDVTISDADDGANNLRESFEKADEKIRNENKQYEKYTRRDNTQSIRTGVGKQRLGRKQIFQRNIDEDDDQGDVANFRRIHSNDRQSKNEREKDVGTDKHLNPFFERTKYDRYLQKGSDLHRAEPIIGDVNITEEKKKEKRHVPKIEQYTSRVDSRSLKSYGKTTEIPGTSMHQNLQSSANDTDDEIEQFASFKVRSDEDSVNCVARRGHYKYRKQVAQDLTPNPNPNAESQHSSAGDPECSKIHKKSIELNCTQKKDVKESTDNALTQLIARRNNRLNYLRKAYSTVDILAESELRKRALQQQYIRVRRANSVNKVEDYRTRSNSEDEIAQTYGLTMVYPSESDIAFKGLGSTTRQVKHIRRTLSSSDTPSQRELHMLSTNDEVFLPNDEVNENERKEKRPSTISVRTISIDMTSLSPHLHMVEPDSSSLSGESFSPPLIPGNIAFDMNSVTSQEPELDLEFNDVIDVANLEEDEIAVGFESQQHDEKRRKRHRHRRRRRKHDPIPQKVDATIENEENLHLLSKENELETVVNHEIQGEKVNEEVDDKVFFEAVKMIDDETRQFNSPYHHPENESASFDKEVFKEDKEVDIDDSGDDIDLEISEKEEFTMLHDQKNVNNYTDKELTSDNDEYMERKDGNGSRPNSSNMVEMNTVKYFDKDEFVMDNERKDGQKKPRHGKRKSKTRRKNYNDQEIDFATLPSIETQIAKIMHNYNYDDQANTSISGRSSRRSSRRHSIATPKLPQRNIYRSRSVSKGSGGRRSSLKRVLKKKRSMSLPNTNELVAMKEQLDMNADDASREAFPVPIYFGSFPSRIAKKQFKTTLDRKRVQGRGRSMSLFISDEDGTNKSELEPLREESQVIDTNEMDRVLTPSTTRIPTPASTNSLLSNGSLSYTNNNNNSSVTEPLSTLGEGHKPSLLVGGEKKSKLGTTDPPKSPVKREIVKKERRPKTPVPAPVRSPSPVEEPPRVSPTPEPIDNGEPVSREISFEFIREPPELPPIEVPELPDIPEAQPTEYKGIKREKKLIEVSPELPAQKKKFPPPPKPRPQIRSRAPSRKTKVAEAPVTTQELQQMVDPLDFLAKYCIINPDRLPFYERVFNGALSVQTPRYPRDSVAPKGAIVHLPPAQLSDHELNMLKDITVLNQGHCPRNDGISAPEQYLEKLSYSMEFIKSKQDVIQTHMEKVQAEKMQFMAGMAKKWDRDIVRLDYKTKIKKKKKKKKKKKGEEPDYDQMGALSDKTNFQPMKASDITDEVIVSRMDDKMMKKIKKDPIYLKYKMEIGRDIEKLKHYDERVAQIEDEKDLVGLYCMDYYFSEQGAMNRPQEFRRQQSRLYQKLHPDPDIEMNIEEVEPALQQINNKLLTEREFQYIYFILDLPKREKINFRLFSIVAALSEKVTQMDPVIRKLINKVDYNALDVKLEKSKELFQLLQDERVLPQGNAPSDNLAVELTAGGLTPEHTTYVMNKFDREGRGFIDFLDFVTYVPLFIEIHSRIIDDPFNDTLCV